MLLTDVSHIEFDQGINNGLRYRSPWNVHLLPQEKKSVVSIKIDKNMRIWPVELSKDLIQNVMKFDYKFTSYLRESSHTIMSER